MINRTSEDYRLSSYLGYFRRIYGLHQYMRNMEILSGLFICVNDDISAHKHCSDKHTVFLNKLYVKRFITLRVFCFIHSVINLVVYMFEFMLFVELLQMSY